MLNLRNEGDRPWRLRGTSLHVAWFVGGMVAVGSVLAVAVDIYADTAWDLPVLQTWTLVPQTLTVMGLMLLWRIGNSTAFMVLGSLIGLIVIEEAFHVLNPAAARLAEVARWANEWSGIRLSLILGVLLYGAIATVGLAFVTASHWHGSAIERPIIRNLAVLLLIGGFFGGVISTLSTLGNGRRWIFVEEFGEAVLFAVIAGYVAGLVATLRHGGVNDSPATAARRSVPGEHP